jgi:hypothetical protein
MTKLKLIDFKKYTLHIKSFKLELIDLFFFIILILSAIIRFWQVKDFNFAFTYDQARDLLEIRPMAYFSDIKFTGPTTSINGLLLGPLYYYFLLPAFWIGGGNPQTITNWNVIWFLISGIIGYVSLKNINHLFAFFVSTIFLFSPQLFVGSSYFWNANSAIYVAMFYFVALALYLKSDSSKNTLFLALSAAITTQFEAAFGIIAFVFSFFLIAFKKKLKNISIFLVVTLPFLLPQVLFEIVHKFQMSKFFLSTFSQNSILGDKEPLNDILISHYKSLAAIFEGQFILPYHWGYYLLIISFIIIFLKKSTRKFAFTFLMFFLFTYIFYGVFYQHHLKDWYLQSYRVGYIFVVGLAFSTLYSFIFSINNKFFKLITFALLTFLITRNYYLVFLDKYQVIQRTQVSDDPKNAKNLINSVDWVMNISKGTKFEAYSYVPEVYDYPYQYLYWWRGKTKFNNYPSVVSYSLTDVPLYLNKPDKFIPIAGGGKTDKIALVYERLSTYKDWLNQFKGYCVVSKEEFPYRVTAEWREKCK